MRGSHLEIAWDSMLMGQHAGPGGPQGTLLMAMANGLPVVSTPYHFALELLQVSSLRADTAPLCGSLLLLYSRERSQTSVARCQVRGASPWRVPGLRWGARARVGPLAIEGTLRRRGVERGILLLQDSRGVLVPFYDNQTALTLALEALLDDGRLRADMVLSASPCNGKKGTSWAWRVQRCR